MIAERLADHQVVQRTGAAGAIVSVPETDDVRALDAADRLVARAEDGELALPTGGPYRLVAGAGRTVAEHVLVGDLWVLAGQSNMQGAGRLVDVERPSQQVNVLDMGRRWRPAEEPLHRLSDSPDPVHDGGQHSDFFDEFGRSIGAGAGVAFGNALAAASGVPVGLVATSHGGSAIAEWAPGDRVASGASLYGSLLRSVEAAGGRVAGVLWYQGETDATYTLDAPASYGPALEALVAALREDVGLPGFRFLHAQLGRYVYDAPPDVVARWSALREVQRRLAAVDGLVSTIDLPLDDAIHISTGGLKRVGRRFARLAAGHEPLTVRDVSVAHRGACATGPLVTVRVRYGGVSGGLRPATRVTGFSVRTADGTPLPRIFEAQVDPADEAAVLVHVSPELEGEGFLWYGHGCDPACNLLDGADVAAPAFGPVALSELAG